MQLTTHPCRHQLCGHQRVICRPSAGRAAQCASRALKTESVSVAPQAAAVHDGRLPLLQTLEQFVSPGRYAAKVLQGHTYAVGRTGVPPSDTLFVADPVTAKSWMTSESQLGIKTKWPDTFVALLGSTSISVTEDPELHARLRQIMSPYFTPDAVGRLLPAVHETVQRHMAGWAAEGTVSAYSVTRLLTFDVLANQALQLGMDEVERNHYAKVFKAWIDGFMPPKINLPFLPYGKGVAARRQLQQRVRQALSNPDLDPDCVLAKLRDEFGAESEEACDNTIVLLFAGHDTTSSAMTYLLYQLARHPQVVDKLREEHQAVQAKHGQQLTPAAIAAMPYTTAVARETLRTAQIVGYVPRFATKPLKAASGEPMVQSGCPFIVALGAMSAADPAVAGDAGTFNPERWLEPDNAKSLAQHQLPFGMGHHYCIGSQLALAELTAVATVLARSYSLTADTDTEWVDFPIKRPTNGLPCQLSPLRPTA